MQEGRDDVAWSVLSAPYPALEEEHGVRWQNQLDYAVRVDPIRDNRSVPKEARVAGVETLGPVTGRDRQRDPALGIGKAEDDERLGGGAPGVQGEEAFAFPRDHLVCRLWIGQRREDPA